MTTRCETSQVVPVHNLRDFFRTSIDEVVTRHRLDPDPQVAQYVVNLLTLFARSEELYDDQGDTYGLRPLALMLADALEAPTSVERNASLQRIGDVALFISGFFVDSLAEKAVDVDYYIHMGENAYGSLSDEVRGTVRGNVFSGIYRQLAECFNDWVDILNEVRDGGRESCADILRTYEIWLKTGSRRAESLLREQGIVPVPGLLGPQSH